MTEQEKMEMLERVFDAMPEQFTGHDTIDVCSYIICRFCDSREEASNLIKLIAVSVMCQPGWDQPRERVQ